jgi:DNA-binding Lrp family transcriptional regulator
MSLKLDEKDLAILNLLQKNCKMTAKEIAKKINSPITTVFAKIKRMEQQGIIKEYRAILDHKKLNFGVTAFILASFSYRTDTRDSIITESHSRANFKVSRSSRSSHNIWRLGYSDKS